jgi:hypothetical protein
VKGLSGEQTYFTPAVADFVFSMYVIIGGSLKTQIVWCESLNRCTKHKKRFCPDDCNKAEFRRWCPSKLKCLRYQDVDGKGKEECPDWK